MRLCPHVRLADVDGDLVFLDTAADAYACLPRSIALPVQTALASDRHCPDAALAAELVAAGLVTESGEGPPWPGNLPATATGDLGPASADVPLTALDLVRLAASAAATALTHRRPPAAWRPRRASSAGRARIHLLARRFIRLRPWIPASGRCLPMARLMRGYLERSGAAVDWVFGVRTHPFDAHCWLEHEGVVLTDHLDHVRLYVPIWRL